jgi:hypothetical protein
MTKKGVQVVINAAQRRSIDVDAMTQIVIALGRELAERMPTKKRNTKTSSSSVKAGP